MKDKNEKPFEIILYFNEAGYNEFNRLMEEEMEKYRPNIMPPPDCSKKSKREKGRILKKLKAAAKYKALRKYYKY